MIKTCEREGWEEVMLMGREGNGTPLQSSCLENPMDGGAWWAAVHGVTRGQTRPSDFTFTFHFHALEEEMAAHSSVLAWRNPGRGEPGGLLSMRLHRVGHDWSDLAAAAAACWWESLSKKVLVNLSNERKMPGKLIWANGVVVSWEVGTSCHWA